MHTISKKVAIILYKDVKIYNLTMIEIKSKAIFAMLKTTLHLTLYTAALDLVDIFNFVESFSFE
jgi:hypothetical protein